MAQQLKSGLIVSSFKRCYACGQSREKMDYVAGLIVTHQTFSMKTIYDPKHIVKEGTPVIEGYEFSCPRCGYIWFENPLY